MSGTGSNGVTYTSQDVWSDDTYNAFTDLTRYDGNWYLVFAASSGQSVPAVGQPGRIRVLESANGQNWTPVAILSDAGGDLRDPKITVTPSNQLMIISGDVTQTAPYVVQSVAWFSSNGTNWGNENPTGVSDTWIWRTVWHDGVGYGIGYGPNNTDPTGGSEQTTWLSTTTNGLNYSAALQLSPTGQMADEAGLTFLPNGTGVMVTRRDAEATSSIGISTAASDYTKWTFTNGNLQLESPNLLTLPDGRIVAAGRMYAQYNPDVAYTGLAWVDPTTGTLTPFLKFANTYGTDTGYPGLYWYNNQLMVSYYSSNPTGPGADIFVAQVTIPVASWAAAVSGSWSTASNWGGAAPGAVGANVVIDAPTSSPLTVTLANPQTVGALQLGNSGSARVGYTLFGSGSNTLTLDNSGSGATITVSNGTHVIAAPVLLADNLVVTGSGTLDFGAAGGIAETGVGHSLTMSGIGGTLILSGSDRYSGGTIVTAGTLCVTNPDGLPSGSSLTVGAGAAALFFPAKWAAAVSGSWSTAGNWTGSVPNAIGAVAVVNAPTASPLTVTLDSPQTVGTLHLGNSGSASVGYSIFGSGSNTLTVDNFGSGATIAVSNGTHFINAPVLLADNLVVTGSGTLDFDSSSGILETGGRRSLTLNAIGGTLILSGSGTYSGGTIVTAGTLCATNAEALPNGSSLTIGAGAAQLFSSPAAGSATDLWPEGQVPGSVPEPGTVGLIVAGLTAGFGLKRLSGKFSGENQYRSPTRKRGMCVNLQRKPIPRLRVGLRYAKSGQDFADSL